MRPQTLDDFAGQEHLVGKDGVIRKALDAGVLPSIILWGPPGSGKTTLAQIIAQQLKMPFKTLSAISSGVKDVRAVIDEAKKSTRTLLFIDEIHRFSKSQQDSLLGAVEKGVITLIGATTENPSFEVISPLLSRCQVYILESLEKDELLGLLERAKKEDIVLKKKKIKIKEHQALLRITGGDARKLLNLFELVIDAANNDKIVITDDIVMECAQQKMAIYDKGGELHYDIISAFIKSIRGSDPNAALYWLARMIQGGEDPKFIARRLLILASEDIGNANPNALLLATNCFQAVTMIGYPECELILSQTVTYLASSPKSNASYQAIKNAHQLVKQKGDLPVPLHIRNAPTKLMKELDYGKDYKYSHNYDSNFSLQEYLPEEISGSTIFNPGNNSKEQEMRNRLKSWWGDKYGY
ncbi:MAG: AAA family ATPase [Bacteroidetes bacterium]|nr:MAG: AAA family ATPase [Bacteroidota bacterium]